MGKYILRKKNLWKSFVIFIVVAGFYTISFTLVTENQSGSEKWSNFTVEKYTDLKTESTFAFLESVRVPSKICQNFLVRRRSFPNLQECTNYTTRLCEENTFNLTALVSYPGSGNTWLRHLIETASGFYTGSVYFDYTLYARGFIGEKENWRSGSTIVQKLHTKYDSRQNVKKAILLIRDPISATRSFVDYMESGHTGWASPTIFNRKEWPMFLLKSVYDWASVAKSWIDSPVDLLVIHYENLVDSKMMETRKVLMFLDLDDSRLNTECFKKSMEGSFHRRIPLWKVKKEIPAKIQKGVGDAVVYLNQMLLSHGKEPIPFKKYPDFFVNLTKF